MYGYTYGDPSLFTDMLTVDLLGMVNPEYIEELGGEGDRPIDAECSLGKGLFKDLMRKVKPPRI